MLSLKLPRVFSIDQMPQVCAPAPVVDFQAVMRVWPLQQGDCSVLNQSALCRPALFTESLPDSLGDESLLFPSLY